MAILMALPAWAISCGHPMGGGVGGTGSGGSTGNTGSGGNNTTGSGGSGEGTGGSGPGTGGDMVITPTDGGVDAPPPTKMSCGDSTYNDKYAPGYKIPDTAVTAAMSALASMQTNEKADQMRGSQPNATIFNQPDNTTRGIKGLKFRDGPRGVCLDAEKVGNGYSTSFPVAMARSASFDLDLEYRVGDAIGDETLASEHTMLLSPTVNILRHPFWGRAQEVYGEDSYVQGRFGSAFTVGIQQYVPACAKHYAANNIENGRASINSAMDTQTLRETYANHFGMIINDGGVACIMASYNLVQNIKATQNPDLLNTMLRTEFGFKGFVLSDWWAMPGGQNPAQTDRAKNAGDAVKAGMDMELPNSLNYSVLESLVPGTLGMNDLNASALRILREKFRFNVAKTGTSGAAGTMGLKKPSTVYSNGSITNDAAHLALAEEAATKGMVLLKNDKSTLPLDRTKLKNVVVIGLTFSYTLGTEGTSSINFATDVRTGDRGSSRVNHDPAKAVGPLAGIKAAAGAAVNVTSSGAANAIANADAAVVVVGLTPQDEGEEYTGAGDRGTFSLDGKSNAPQTKLISDVASMAGGKPVIVVVESGAVVDISAALANANVGAIVWAGYSGQRGGLALGKLLFADNGTNFSGKLPITWDSNTGDWPMFHTGNSTNMEYDLGYQYFDKKGTAAANYLPFGHGLSYSKFTYSNLQVPCTDVTKGGVVPITVDITNASAVPGDEIAFLFVSYPGATKPRHPKELKAFARVHLDGNQTKRVNIQLRVADLHHYDTAAKAWTVDPGMVQVMVGPSSRDLPLKDTFMIK